MVFEVQQCEKYTQQTEVSLTDIHKWGKPVKKFGFTSFKKCESFYFTICDGLTLAKCHQHTFVLKNISFLDIYLRESFYQKRILFFFQSNLIVYKNLWLNFRNMATIKYYIGVISAAAKVLFKSILAIINIEGPDSATCLFFHHNHLTVAYVLVCISWKNVLYGKEEHKNQTQKCQVPSPRHNFSPTLLFICAFTACRATFLSGSSGTLA